MAVCIRCKKECQFYRDRRICKVCYALEVRERTRRRWEAEAAELMRRRVVTDVVTGNPTQT